MRALPILLAFTLGTVAAAQFDLGGGLGGYAYVMYANKAQGPRTSLKVTSGQDLPWTASLHYRERVPKRLNFGAELRYVRREFHTRYQGEGLGFVDIRAMDVSLDMLYVGILPEWPIDERGMGVIRFGVLGGLLLGSSTMQGQYEVWTNNGTYDRETYVPGYAADFRGDLRLAVGIGLRYPLGQGLAVAIDPYWSAAITSMLKWEVANVGMGGHDMGLTLGLSWARPHGGIWPRSIKDRTRRG